MLTAGQLGSETLPELADEAAPLEPVPGTMTARVADRRASFASFEAPAIRTQSVRYIEPDAVPAPEPPLSLSATDGTGLELVSLNGQAVIDGPVAFTELHLTFRNPRDREIEGRFAITLPPGATVSRLAMLLDTGWQEAEVVERQRARRAYEDFLHRRQDPALLEKQAGNAFGARIFPIPARGTKEIIISYSQSLVGRHAVYRLPLRGLPEVSDLRVKAMVGDGGVAGKAMSYQVQLMEERGYVPDKDFEVAIPVEITGLRSDELVCARVRPELSVDNQSLDGLVVLFDTSASRALGFSRQVAQLGQLMQELARIHGSDTTLALATFDQVVVEVYRGTLGGFGQDQLDAILAHRPLGASNVHGALTWAGAQDGVKRILLVSDGIATAGPSDSSQLRAGVKSLAAKFERLDIILSGGIRDEEGAARMVRGTLPRDGVILDAGDPVEILARRISQTTASGIKVRIPGAEWVWPERLDGVQPGDEVLVFAQLSKTGPAPGKPLRVDLSGALEQSVEIPLTPVARPLIERAAAAAQIARLSEWRSRLGSGNAEHKDQRGELKAEIVRLSTHYRVLSNFTALLVLETEADYARFEIDRRALADILTIGEKGIEIARRTEPIMLMASRGDGDRPGDKLESGLARREAKEDNGEGRDPADLDAPEPDKAQAGATASAAMEDDFDDEVSSAEGAAGGSSGLIDLDLPEAWSSVRGNRANRPPPPRAAPSIAALRPQRVASGAGIIGRVDRRRPVRDLRSDFQRSRVPAYSGKMADIMGKIERKQSDQAVAQAMAWRSEKPGDVLALIALGEALEAQGKRELAARAYGSLIDLFPARADMRRFAGGRLERLADEGGALAADSYAKAAEQRPDHLTVHRLLAYALLRQGKYQAAFDAAAAGLARSYPVGRFAGGKRILKEDLGLIAAAWHRHNPKDMAEIAEKLAQHGTLIATKPSLRFVLNWETDANDVDFHIFDGQGGHAFFSQPSLASGGRLYEDVTTGYGPECFTIEGKPRAYPYNLQLHYYSRGPMGYGMGKLEIVQHNGNGDLIFEQRPFVIMNDNAYVDLGAVERGGLTSR